MGMRRGRKVPWHPLVVSFLPLHSALLFRYSTNSADTDASV